MGKVGSGFGLQKCTKSAKRERLPEDHISQLPNEILVCILSYLTVKEAARTSVVSKRWTNLWTYIGCLDFDAPTQLEKIAVFQDWTEEYKIVRKRERCKYVKWVNKVLQSHKALALDDFRIYFDLNKSSQGAIDKWLRYAFDRKVQRIELNLMENGDLARPSSESYTFPVGLLGLRSGRSPRKNPRATVDFKSLRALSLKKVNVCGEVLKFFISSCQFLECLVVHGSADLITFEVSGPCVALKNLEICFCINLECLTVCNVNLVSLKATQVSELVLKNLPMLVDVNVRCRFTRVLRDVIPSLFCYLPKLEVLTLHVSSKEAIQLKVMFLELPQLTTLKQLILETASEGESLLGLAALIRAAPNLEKLVMKLEFDTELTRRRRELEKAVNYPLQHLQVLEFFGYCGRTCDLELVKYFLENAPALEKIIIDPRVHFGFDSPPLDWEIEEEKISRRCANRQLKGLIPSHVELVIF